MSQHPSTHITHALGFWLEAAPVRPTMRNGARRGGAEEDRTPDPLRARQVLSQLSYGPGERERRHDEAWRPSLVGLTGFEPVTSPLSGVRSNQLSYRPSAKHGRTGFAKTGHSCERPRLPLRAWIDHPATSYC